MAKILFIYPAIENESMAIEYISSYLKSKNHQTALILNYKPEKYFEKRLRAKIKEFNPDFIGFSVVTDDYFWASNIAKLVKNIKNIPIIFGGIQVTSCPEEVISKEFVDYAVLGEGEQAILEILENPKKTNIKNTWCKKKGKIIRNPLRPLIQDLDALPMPDKGLFLKEAPYLNDIYHCITSRGCPFACTYCFNNYMKNLYKSQKWLRKRGVENVIKELKFMKRKFKYKQVLFIDDCFTFDRVWLKKFIKLYKKEIKIPFKIIAHPSFIDDEVAKLLKQGGCIRVQVGVQTPMKRIRKDICKRVETNEIIEKAIKALKKVGIMTQIDHIFGLPTENVKEYLDEGIEFYIKLKPNFISCFWLQYYPNTEIVEIGKKTGEITQEIIDSTIKGKIDYDKNTAKRKENKELLEISSFFSWIPLFPRFLSRYLLRKRYYKFLFKINKLAIFPYLIQHLRSLEYIKIIFMARKRKRMMENYYYRLDKEIRKNNFKNSKSNSLR